MQVGLYSLLAAHNYLVQWFPIFLQLPEHLNVMKPLCGAPYKFNFHVIIRTGNSIASGM